MAKKGGCDDMLEEYCEAHSLVSFPPCKFEVSIRDAKSEPDGVGRGLDAFVWSKLTVTDCAHFDADLYYMVLSLGCRQGWVRCAACMMQPPGCFCLLVPAVLSWKSTNEKRRH